MCILCDIYLAVNKIEKKNHATSFNLKSIKKSHEQTVKHMNQSFLRMRDRSITSLKFVRIYFSSEFSKENKTVAKSKSID